MADSFVAERTPKHVSYLLLVLLLLKTLNQQGNGNKMHTTCLEGEIDGSKTISFFIVRS